MSDIATLIDGKLATVPKAVKLLSTLLKRQEIGRKQYVEINRGRLSKPDLIPSIS